ncbi:unnamed protein product [Paramecium sonneborni]|uniref:Casein kinase I n=1 Tax=Paramecium sonneborni TaxID=65129 RepID=A0A8S1P8A6_9CILI|nr:unnamed protein product [Paramecium sonneborni]
MRSTKKHATTHAENSFKLSVGQIIAQKFKLIDKVGQGSFGMIFKTENLETGDIFATKFEKREENQNGMSLLVREIKVLIEVQEFEGFPQIVFYGRDEHYNYFMQTYLGQNLEHLLKRNNYKFSLCTVCRIGINLIDRLKLLHSKNLIHRDLKPDNICIGYEDVDQIYLIDFGLSKYYRDQNGTHIPQIDKKGIIGTARYASLTAHLAKEQSRKDDIESLGYVLVYLAKGKLPWMNLNTTTKSEKYQKIKEFKQQLTLEKLCEGLPKCFLNLFIYARGLDFQGEPDYAFLKELFQKQLQLESQQGLANLEYEWERYPEIKKRKSRLQTNLLKQKIGISSHIQKNQFIKVQIQKFVKIVKIKVKSIKEVLFQIYHLKINKLIPNHLISKINRVEYIISNYSFQNISQNISSFGTSQINNYQISQIDKFKRFQTERKDQRNNTVDTQKKERETSPNQKIFIKQTTTKTERKMAFFEIDNDYRDYDHIDQIANEEVKIVFSNIIPNFGRHKSTSDL